MTLFEPHGSSLLWRSRCSWKRGCAGSPLDGSLSRPTARRTWEGEDGGQKVDLPRSSDLPTRSPSSVRVPAGVEHLPGLGQWAEEGQGGPAGLVLGSVISKKGLRPASPARTLQTRRPGWQRTKRSHGAWGALPSGGQAGRARADSWATYLNLFPFHSRLPRAPRRETTCEGC